MKINGEDVQETVENEHNLGNLVILVNMVNRAASAKLELFLIDFQGLDSVVERRRRNTKLSCRP
jgi:hypothetical protein